MFACRMKMNCTRLPLRCYSTATPSHINQRIITETMVACRMNFTRLRRYNSQRTLSLNDILSLNHAFGVSKAGDSLEVFQEMLQRQPPPSIIQFNNLITSIVKMRRYSTALKLINQIKLASIPVNIYTVAIAINCHCRLNQVSYGFALLATLLKQGHSPNMATYTTLIRGLFLSDRVIEAVELFKKLHEKKVCEPDQIMFGTVISGLCKVGHTNKALAVLSLMESSSCKPCVHQYNAVIGSLCKDRMVDDALELFAKMTERGVLADANTYNSLVQVLCNFGRESLETEAAKLLRDMEEKLVNFVCKKGSVKDTELVVQAMLRKGLEPNVVGYSALIDGYCLRGKVDKAKKVIDHMVEKDLVPNIITYNSLINGYCKKKRIDEAIHLFQEIQSRGLIPDVITYNTMLQGLFQSGNTAAARELYKEMQAKGQTTSGATYQILFHGMCDNGECSDALALFRSLGNEVLMKDIGLYNILIAGCRKHGKPNLAMDIFNELLMKGLKPDMYTYTMMISVYCKEGLRNKARKLHGDMKVNGCSPNNLTYFDWLKCWMGLENC